MGIKKIFISAGDSSGDIHAARLMKHIKELAQDVEFIGLGGSEMLAEGLQSLVPLSSISVVGFWEVFKRFGFFKELLARCEKILSEDVAAFIPVDYPGFNLRLAQKAKRLGIPVAYYIAPQLWAWGKRRAQKLAHSVDFLIVVFPFEVDFFKQFGIDAYYTGHPIMDQPVFNETPKSFVERSKTIAFFPGSRRQEIERHLPLLESVRLVLEKKLEGFDYAIAKSPLIEHDEYSGLLKGCSNWIIEENRFKLLGSSRAGLIKTGTSNLEATLMGLPYAMFYKTSAITYFLGKRLINLDFLSITNILNKRAVIKEFIQNDADPKAIADELAEMATNSVYWNAIHSNLITIKNILGGMGASKRAAGYIVEKLNLAQ
jgi:lipid-A-disaccharide synthase